MLTLISEIFKLLKKLCPLTFHNIDKRANISFLNDNIINRVFHRIHTLHYSLYLTSIQVLHEIIIKYRVFDEIPSTGK